MNINERIKPNTEFMIYKPNQISSEHFQILNHLYLPIIGPETLMTYVYFYHLNPDNEPFNFQLHRVLLDGLNVTISDLESYTNRLEAIGLMKTYQSTREHDDVLMYELLLPLTPELFFKDTMLSFYLHRQVGSASYKILTERFSYPKRPDGFVEISKKFSDVFETDDANLSISDVPSQRHEIKSTGPNVDMDDFDFDVLFTHLKGTKIDRQFFDTETKLLIVKLSVLFKLNAYDMKHILLECTDARGGIDHRKLKSAARKYFQREQKTVRKKPEASKQVPEQKDAYFERLEGINPLDRITTIRQHKPTEEDLKIVTELLTRFSFTNGAINVLIEYVYQQLEGEIPFNYVMTVAKTWQESGVSNAQDALSEVQQFKERQTKYKKKQSYSKKDRPGEVRPEWLDQVDAQNAEPDADEPDENEDNNEFDTLLNYFKKGE